MITHSQKGEGRPYQLSEADHLEAFAHLSDPELLQGSCKLEQLTCILYSNNETRVNDARLQTLLSKMSQHVKTFDPASLPPWQAVMNQ